MVAVGGGIVTDVAGFAAATYHRGTAYVNVATTLLAQVDAAIGGKTGVNLPEGKNLVGAFWQPDAVLCDTETLVDPPAPRVGLRPRRDGQVRLSRRRSPRRTSRSTSRWRGASASKRPSLPKTSARAAGAWSSTTATPWRTPSRARRMADHPDWDLRHGEAVAVGLVFAALLARRSGRIDERRVGEHREHRRRLDLPTDLPPGAAPRSCAFMGRDKKAQQDLTFVLDGPDGVEPVRDVAGSEVVATLAAMGARA